MLTIRRSDERGKSNWGCRASHHAFSFGGYVDPAWMGFRILRVINEDRVTPGQGFGTHPHRDMEILSYVIKGAMEHKDSMGTGSLIVPGELQRMTAGTGITHSEFNPSTTDSLHFLQIWIVPEKNGLRPGYEQRAFPIDEQRGKLVLIASQDGRNDSLTVHQNVSLYAGRFDNGQAISHSFGPQRNGWMQVVRGSVLANGEELRAGDGGALNGGETLKLRARSDAEVLLFDLN